jgi:hypothetical protein
MPAGVEEGADAADSIPKHDYGAAADVERQVVAGLGDFALEHSKQPAAMENAIEVSGIECWIIVK